MLLDTKDILNISGIAYGIEQLAFVDYPEGNGDLTFVANLGNSNNLPAPTFKIKLTDLTEDDNVTTPTADTNENIPDKNTNVALWAGIGIAVVVLVAVVIFLIKKRFS